jgi:hypothetical protein
MIMVAFKAFSKLLQSLCNLVNDMEHKDLSSTWKYKMVAALN